MKDLQKLREEFESKLRFAEMANEFETKFGVEPQCFECFGKILITCKTDKVVAGKILRELVADEKIVLNEVSGGSYDPFYGMYSLMVHRDYNDSDDTLRIKFHNNKIEYWVELKVGDVPEIEKYFKKGTRKLASHELSTYKPVRRGHICREYEIPCRRWICNEIAYSGGNYVALSNAMEEEIVNVLTNL